MPAFQPLSATKRKHEEDETFSRKRVSLPGSSPTFNDLLTESANNEAISFQDHVWMVQWRNPQYKKHKTWDGDATLVVNGQGTATLYDSAGKIISTGKASLPLREGKNFSVGGKEIELERTIPREQYLSGVCFGQHSGTSTIATKNNNPIKKFISPSFTSTSKHISDGQEKFTTKSQTTDEASRHEYLWHDRDIPSKPLSEITNMPSHWTANWRKPQDRKNKTWDGDAYVSLVRDKLIMMSEEGKIMGSILWKGQALCSGFNTMIGGKEVELDLAVSASQLPTLQGQEPTISEQEVLPESSGIAHFSGAAQANQKFVAPTSFYAVSKPKSKGPLHDPEAEDALVMKYPTKEHIKRYNKRNLPVVPVVVDPILSRKMRPHQRDGVCFLYECVMGLRKHEGQGCMLADEMGLGKTLQTIALVWTLLRQNPYAGPLPAVQKVLIVCPVSLVNNWKAEFHKWLGRDRVGIMTCDKNNAGIDAFGRSKVYEVLIIGYERLRTVIDKIANLHPPIGLIICDEGHRLKSANNKTASMFKALDSRRRIILSGTPIQNDLGEFHAMSEFCNPGLLDDYSVFRRVYENPILKSRALDASEKDVEIGEARTAQLLSIAKSFVLRRDATLLKNHLPPKSEYVVFVTPTPLQLAMFSRILHPAHLDDLIQSSTAESLALINVLTKISNSPILLKATADNIQNKKNESSRSLQRMAVLDALDLLPEKAHIADMSLSGKLIILSKILKILRQNTGEKCVLVSHYTSTLNILEAYCKRMSYSYCRLDGQTPQNKRQEYVNTFNKGNQHNSCGVGINLVGASRLFIVDSDWNPSHDLQSMARCHRDGQKRPVFIYRLLTAGAIDEKIYQRQITKLALSDSLIGSGTTGTKSDSFTRKDLRDIFRIHPETGCNTHDLLECGCDTESDAFLKDTPSGDLMEQVRMTETGFVAASEVRKEVLDEQEQVYLQKKKAGLAALGEWSHINCLRRSACDCIQDDILRKVIMPRSSNNVEHKPEHGQLDGLLSAVDLDVIEAMDIQKSIRDVPGGTISFLFEKHSKSNLDSIVE